MPNKPKPPSSDANRKGDSARPDLSDALRALREATQALSSSAEPLVLSAPTGGPPPPAGSAPPDLAAAPVTGQQRDLPEQVHRAAGRSGRASVLRARGTNRPLGGSDGRHGPLALPPRVTHVRRPDGTIKRRGFSAY